LFKFTSDLEALKELALKRFSALFWNLVENDFILNWKLNIIDAKKKKQIGVNYGAEKKSKIDQDKCKIYEGLTDAHLASAGHSV